MDEVNERLKESVKAGSAGEQQDLESDEGGGEASGLLSKAAETGEELSGKVSMAADAGEERDSEGKAAAGEASESGSKTRLRQTTVRSPLTGVPILEIGGIAGDTAHHYFTAMTWLADSRSVVLYTNIARDTMRGSVLRLDLDSGEEMLLQEEVSWARGVVSCDDLLYLIEDEEMYTIDTRTGERRTLCRLASGSRFHPVSITNDGDWIGTYWEEAVIGREAAGATGETMGMSGTEEGTSSGISDEVAGAMAGEAVSSEAVRYETVIGTVNTRTGEIREHARPVFAEPYPVANHVMINPVQPELLFYSHEGTTEFIPDRLWVLNSTTGETRNVFKQKLDADNRHVEYVGHEIWAFDGSGLYFVKYPHSPDKPTGVYFVEKWGERADFVNGDYKYWHVGISPDGRYAVADTQEPGVSKIVLIDVKSKQSHLLCEYPCRGNHPGHPHPAFSPDSRKVIFTFSDEADKLHVGIIDLQDVVPD